jgi:hypothetical protein
MAPRAGSAEALRDAGVEVSQESRVPPVPLAGCLDLCAR